MSAENQRDVGRKAERGINSRDKVRPGDGLRNRVGERPEFEHSIEPGTGEETAGGSGPMGRPSFARHETFAPRFGWLRKGYVVVRDKPRFFLEDDAHLRLGVGKNMARSIRYWCHAVGLIEDVELPGGRGLGSAQTVFGRRLLGKNGWDQYLEDPASLWLLHWRLVRTPTLATAWHYTFTILPDIDFTVDGLSHMLGAYTAAEYMTARTAHSSFKKDASCIARMYGEAAIHSEVSDESIQSPFADLGLLHKVAGDEARSQRYRFEIAGKRSLPPAVVAAACLEFAARVTPGARTILLSRLLSDRGSPGMAFKLGESALANYLELAASKTKGLSLADAAGLVQLVFGGRPSDLVARLLTTYYGSNRRSVAA